MSKRPFDIDSTLYLLEILRRIPKSRKIDSTELHRQLIDAGFERSHRSVQRALESLSAQFDIERDDVSKPYGYRWKKNSAGLELPILTVQQSLVLMLAEQQLQHLLPANIMASMKPFFEQAKKTLVDDSRDKPEAQWLNKISIAPTSQPLIPAKIDDAIFHSISTALYQNKYLNIQYKNQQSKVQEARVMPLALVQQGASCYLVVQFEGFDDIRHLALHRFISAEISTMTFQRPTDFKLKTYITEGGFGFANGNKVRLRFYIEKWAGFHLTETPLSNDQIIDELEDCYQVQASVQDSVMLDWWLAKFGDEIWGVEKEPLERAVEK